MFPVHNWLSVCWLLLLPLASALGSLSRYCAYRRARQRDLLTGGGYRWLLLALAASQVVVLALLASSVFETMLELPALALVAVLVMAEATRRATPTVHPGLHGFLRPVPRDGMEPLAWGMTTRWRLRRLGWTASRIAPSLPAAAICTLVLASQSGPRPILWLLLPAVFGPLLIVPLGRVWYATCLLLLPALVLGRQALQLRLALPPGRWITPMTSAACSNAVRMDVDRTHAWCADERNGQVYQFRPDSGWIERSVPVESGAQVFASNASRAWILQNPVQGLVLVEGDRQTRIPINFPSQGTVDRAGALWLTDVSGTLWVQQPGGTHRRVTAAEGLPGSTANVVRVAPDGSVWVGAVGGVSYLPAGSTVWEQITRQDGLPGPVMDIAFAADGSPWYLWRIYALGRAQWGVSSQQSDRWHHFELGAPTGLNVPASQDPLAVDGLGRVWFTAASYAQRMNFLGILAPGAGRIQVYPLGPFALTAAGLVAYPGPHGILSDGQGGIYVYDPGHAPLRHWRPK